MATIITTLQPNQVFVFGSNLAGHHWGGAALQALAYFGAVNGVGEGLRGQSYAFPTLTEHLQKLSPEALEQSRDYLYSACRNNPNKKFLLTKVGCGIAGYPESQMRTLFTDPPENLILPKDWQ